MQYKIYRNNSTNFTFENIYSHVNKYWTNEVINKKNFFTKIWLTIVVSTKNNKKYKLINSLPFNTKDTGDILFVIKKNLNKISLCNRKDIIENITIKHRFDKNTCITPKLSVFNYFKLWLLSYTNTEIKLTNDISSNYFKLKKDIYNSSKHLSNNLEIKNLKEESDILGFNKHNRNNIHRNKKGKH